MRGTIVSPLANTCEKHLLTDHLSAKQPHPIANIGELSTYVRYGVGLFANNYRLQPYNFFCLNLRGH